MYNETNKIKNLNKIKDLKNSFYTNDFKIYNEIESITRSILTEISPEEQTIKFPVNIRKVIKEHHIDIAEMDLNLDLGFRMDRVNGYLRRLRDDSDNGWRIYIEYSDSEFVKRYILAHEFSHYLLKKGEEIGEGVTQLHCVDPMLPKKREELLADAMAAYFLLPPTVLLDQMNDYKERMRRSNMYPVDPVAFLRDIGNQAQISTYHTFLCYQYVRYYLCSLYEEESKKEKENREKTGEASPEGGMTWIEKYGELFK